MPMQFSLEETNLENNKAIQMVFFPLLRSYKEKNLFFDDVDVLSGVLRNHKIRLVNAAREAGILENIKEAIKEDSISPEQSLQWVVKILSFCSDQLYSLLPPEIFCKNAKKVIPSSFFSRENSEKNHLPLAV